RDRAREPRGAAGEAARRGARPRGRDREERAALRARGEAHGLRGRGPGPRRRARRRRPHLAARLRERGRAGGPARLPREARSRVEGAMTSPRRWRPRGAPGLRIANCSGFYGDRLSAAREMLEGGPLDFLTGDYLAELTMLILWKGKQRDPSAGYAV